MCLITCSQPNEQLHKFRSKFRSTMVYWVPRLTFLIGNQKRYIQVVKMFRILEPKIENIFLLISFNICLDAQKNRLEYPQHVFWLRNKKNIFHYALLSSRRYGSYLSLFFCGIFLMSVFHFIVSVNRYFVIFVEGVCANELTALDKQSFGR